MYAGRVLLCVSEAHTKERVLVILSKQRRPARNLAVLPLYTTIIPTLGGSRGIVGTGPSFVSLPPQLQPNSSLKGISGIGRREHGGIGMNKVSYGQVSYGSA